tara:strand:- start:2486 stop:3340 length:855 start_codon:yes stop_codon:yes gene_type:complete
MNKKFLNFGKVLRFLQFHRLINKQKLNNSVRIFYSHEVKNCDFENFEKNINYILQNSNVLKPKDFFTNLKNNNFKGKNTMFSFDDGLLSSYQFAKEILSKYNIKAMFFIPTAILDIEKEDDMKKFVIRNIHYGKVPSKDFSKDEFLLMNKKHLVDLSSEGHLIFPHTKNHIFIKDITNQSLVEKELIRPQKTIEEITGNLLKAFAFPVGTERQVSKYAYDRIKENYDYCFTAFSGLISKNINHHKLYRSHLPGNAPITYLKLLLEGVYDPYYKVKMSRISSIIK